MAKVAFIGLGAMGSRMAANLLKAGHDLTVWNRAPAAADKLVSSGAKKAHTPREAAAGNDFVITMVSNDEASRQVWLDEETGALAGLKQGAIAIESSTLTPAWVRELAVAMTSAGIALLDAMVSGSTPQAESGDLVYLVGGEREALQRAEPVFKSLGSSIRYAGPSGCGGRWCMEAGGSVARVGRLRRVHAVQAQYCPPPPYLKAAFSGDELAGL